MSVYTRCRRCGKSFEADRDAILAGDWRECPACRSRDEGTTDHEDDKR